MRRILIIGAGLGLANLASAQLALEDFESGTFPPTGWTVVDNVGNGDVWQTSSYWTHGNLAGSGECAAIDSDNVGSGTIHVDTELITPTFSVPATGYALLFEHYYDWLTTGEFADVDISAGGGAWSNLAHYVADTSGSVSIGLDAYVGTTLQVRFHYDDAATWAWYWHVDDVTADVPPPPPPPVTYVDADTMNQPATTNTTFADGSPFTPPLTTVTVPADNQFWERTGYANDGDILASAPGSDSPMLRTTIAGLTPGVDYEVFVYYWWADNYGNGEWDISAGFTQATCVGYLYTDGSAIADPATHFTDPTIMVLEGNRDMYELALGTATAGTSGTIDVYIDDYPGNDDRTWYDGLGYRSTSTGPGTAYCFGNTASGNACPCGNDNDGSDPAGAGCAHDDSAAGARLQASGVASVSGDTLLFEGFHGPISNSSLFFQANNSQDGNGLYLGDGIRCAGGGLIRLKVKVTDATGYADSSPMVVTTRSASFGHTIAAGETLYYQWWFRDINGSPCGTESNTSNGYMITWTP